jgi:hypothetical protein
MGSPGFFVGGSSPLERKLSKCSCCPAALLLPSGSLLQRSIYLALTFS